MSKLGILAILYRAFASLSGIASCSLVSRVVSLAIFAVCGRTILTKWAILAEPIRYRLRSSCLKWDKFNFCPWKGTFGQVPGDEPGKRGEEEGKGNHPPAMSRAVWPGCSLRVRFVPAALLALCSYDLCFWELRVWDIGAARLCCCTTVAAHATHAREYNIENIN